MNPKIKQLAEQAGLRVESWMTNPPKPFQILGDVEAFEKFTELVIAECFACNKLVITDFKRDPDFSAMVGRNTILNLIEVSCANEVKETFGID